MERKKILQQFLEKQIQLEPQLLDYLAESPEKVSFLLEKAIASGQTFLRLKDVKDLLQERKEIKILKSRERERKTQTLDVNSFTQLLLKRYEVLKNLLCRRIELANLLSIRKVNPTTKIFSVVGMVFEKNRANSSILLEDPTGTLEISVPEEKSRLVVEDEVVGVLCKRSGSEIRAERIVFPEVPLRQPKKTSKDVEVIFSQAPIPTNNYLFVFNGSEDDFVVEEYPTLVDVEGVKILVCKGSWLKFYEEEFNLSREKTLLELLKKRHLNPKLHSSSILDDELFLLSEPPDILAVKSDSERTNWLNYKGVTIVVCGKESVRINLRTREIFKKD